MRTYLTPKEVAEAIGVSESSIKRWADTGRIRVNRTAGGHRRISRVEAIRFVRDNHISVIHPALLGMPDVASLGPDLPPDSLLADQLYEFLESGQRTRARGLVLSLYLQGMDIAEICDGPVREAMHRLGELWLHTDEGIFIEHRATDICIEAIEQLRVTVPPSEEGAAPVALGGAAEHDPYLLPTLMVATVLAGEGYYTVNLGPNTPVMTLRHACTEYRPDIVWLSVSVDDQPANFVQDLSDFDRHLRSAHPSTRLIVGGRGTSGLGLRSIPRLSVAGSMNDLAEMARRIADGMPADRTNGSPRFRPEMSRAHTEEDDAEMAG
ncbi:MAG: helix-turn-helix domain-containing protein [Planctomycetota bacterium]